MSTNLLSAGNIKDLYTEESDKYECKNPGCRIKETTNAKHKTCGKCGKVKYCSRECQVAHWPHHKRPCREWRKMEENEDENDGFKRVSSFSKKYGPLCGSIVQHLFPSKISREGKIAMVCLDELAQSYKSPRMEIKLVGRIDIDDLPGDLRAYCSKSVKRERKRVKGLGQDPNDVICALFTHTETATFMVVPYVFHDEKDPFAGTAGQAKTAINLFCQLEVDRIVSTINSLARGESKDLKSATKRPTGTK